MDPDLAALRADYMLGGLSDNDLADDPLAMFLRWFGDARDAVPEPTAMVLATTARSGQPSARAVLLKGVEEGGFVFFTNTGSRKGREIAANPLCALTFPWFELQRQVRVEGSAVALTRAEDEAYFTTRPRASQLGAWASAQSEVVADRVALEESYAAAERRFAGQDVPCPPFWGGYRVVPEAVEFWQGRQGRMHDRLRYRRAGDGWKVERLAP